MRRNRSPLAIPLAGFAAALSLCAATAATAATTYRVTFTGNDLIQSTPVRRSQSYPISGSNATATFTGEGFAYPGHVGLFERIDVTWLSGFSGGAAAEVLCTARTTDFVISGPSGPSVSGTLHLRYRGSFARAGGFANNNAHGSGTYVRAEANFILKNGNYYLGNFGTTADGIFTGLSGNSVDVPFAITGTFPVGSPFFVDLQVDGTGYTYGNVFNTNPGFVETNAGKASAPPVTGGLELEEVGGQVMTLPPGYTLNSASWGVTNNHFHTTVAVEPEASPGDLTLAIGPNPSAADVAIAFTQPHAGSVALEIFDASGRRVRELARGWMPAGANTLEWDGRDAAGSRVRAGVYFARLTAVGGTLVRRVARLD